MTDEELAIRIACHEVGSNIPDMPASQFVRDGRVCLAMMELWSLKFNEMNFFMAIRNPVQAIEINTAVCDALDEK